MLLHWIWLAHRPSVTDRMKVALLQHFSDPEDVFYADSDAFQYVEGLTKEAKESLADKDLEEARKILAICRKDDLHILTFRDAAYPARLKNIADPPILLYYKGNLPDLDGSPAIGIVGTRKASAYGLQTAKRMGYQIGCCGGIVVSGMALGIDSVAMAGAMAADQCVVGVLGCGANVVYPPSNRSLFADTERYGCIISEFAPGTPPVKWNFPRRNRIISGLSCGVLVVEAPEKSGALITARQAADQGRDVFVVPGNIDVSSCAGSNRLLRDGAVAVSSGWDVLSEYQGLYPDKIHKDLTPAIQNAYSDELQRCTGEEEKHPAKVAQTPQIPRKKENLKEELKKKGIDKEPSSPYIDLNDILPKLSEEERAFVLTLRNGEKLVDEVIAETGMTTGKVLALMTMLELKGVIRRLPGKRVTLK